MQILFDSKCADHKTPFGCLCVGEVCTLCVKIPDCCGCKEASLTLEGENGFFLSVSLLPSERTPPYTSYKTTFTLPEAGLYFYYFKIRTDKTVFSLLKEGNGTNMERGERWQISCLPADFHTPASLWGAVYYQIFPDRFYKERLSGTQKKKTDFCLHTSENEIPDFLPNEKGEILNCDFFGGNLQGIRAKLPYLASLSVSAIYLNPVFEAYSNHRYDTADYHEIDPLLGTEEDFRALCEEAHALGMKIILDGVFSHTGADSRYFDKHNRYGGGAYHYPDSPYRAWYQFVEYPHKYTCWWGIDTLPATNELCPSYLDFIIEGENSVVAHWLRAGADGFRLDVADELPDEFLLRFYRRVKELKQDAIVIGEVWEDASSKISYGVRRRYFTGGELDSVMNYPFRESIIAFVKGDIPADGLAERVMRICENYPKEVLPCLLNSLSTHDTERILTVLSDVKRPERKEERAHRRLSEQEKKDAKERLFCAVFLQFTLPGSPCIYYGDEAGAEGYEDPFCRAFFPWGREDGDLLSLHRALGALRKKEVVLREGDCRITPLGKDALLITRTKGDERLFCALTRGESVPISSEQILFSRGYKDGKIQGYGFAVYR